MNPHWPPVGPLYLAVGLMLLESGKHWIWGTVFVLIGLVDMIVYFTGWKP